MKITSQLQSLTPREDVSSNTQFISLQRKRMKIFSAVTPLARRLEVLVFNLRQV